MTCGDPAAARLVEACLDGELDVVRSVEVERHLQECASCAAVARDHRALRSALADPALYHELPPGLADRVRREVAGVTVAPRPGARPAPWWAAVAAVVPLVAVVGWALAVIARAPSADEQLGREVVSAHVRSLMADHLTDVASSDRHTVKPWFNGKLDFSPEVPDLGAVGYPLIGGRLDYLEGRPVAALVYARGKHPINVFVWPGSDGAGSESSLQGYNIIRWGNAGMRYCAVSDLNLPELRELVRDLQR